MEFWDVKERYSLLIRQSIKTIRYMSTFEKEISQYDPLMSTFRKDISKKHFLCPLYLTSTNVDDRLNLYRSLKNSSEK